MLKRAFVLVVLALLPFTAAAAIPVDDLTTLAENFPADTGLFFTVQADDDFIATADTILSQIEAAITAPQAPQTRPVRYQGSKEDFTPVQNALDDFAQEFFGGDFATTMRPWLGDSAAFGITDFTPVFEVGIFDNADAIIAAGEFPIIMALEITDPAGAIEAVDTALDDQLDPDLTLKVETGDYTYYQARDVALAMLVTPRALLFGRPDDLLNAIDTPAPTLQENPDFTETMGLLLENDYNSLIYVDYRQFIREGVLAAAELDPTFNFDTSGNLAFFDEVVDTVKGLGIGATILDGRTLTLDIVQNADYTELEPFGVQYALPFRMNPAFAERIPASAGLVMMSSDLAGLYEASLENLRANARLLEEQGDAPEGTFTEADIDGALFAVRFFLRRYTGLNLEDDILTWMESDYALVLGLTDEVATADNFDDLTTIPLDFGLLFDVADNAEIAAESVAGFTEAIDTLIEDFETEPFTITKDTETIAGAEVLVYTIVDETGFNIGFPVEVLMGANDEVFVIGSRKMAETALRGDGGLRESTAFQEAETLYLVEDAGILLLINSEALLPFAEAWVLSNPFNEFAESEAQIIRNVLNLFSSATISGSNAEDGVGVSRATISLNLSE